LQGVKPEVKPTPASRLIWGLWAAAMLLMVAGITSTVITWSVDVGPRWGFRGIILALIPVYCTMGALILGQHPRHTVGWLLFYTGSMTLLQHLVDEYAVWALLVVPGQLPGALLAAWIVNFSWLLVAGPLVFLLPLLYPNGRVPSPRWRWVPWLAVATLVTLSIVWMFAPGPMESSYMFLDNPYGWEAGAALIDWLTPVAFGSALSVLALGLLALIWRLRHAAGVERQQLKWFLFAATLTVVSLLGAGSDTLAVHIFTMASIIGLALAVAAAILRYRLYDLDLLVNRALVYAGLTATLGLLYFGSVLLLQAVFLTITGEGQPQLVTVLSTLAIAALFSPVRSRLQRFIDRRFFRKKYDAARTLAAFGATLRDQTNLAQLSTHMIQVVNETMQPAQVSLWLRGGPGSRIEQRDASGSP
jgi:hypothetical protein